MSLIQCPDCQTPVSSTALTCPKCNARIQAYIAEAVEQEKKSKKLGCFAVIALAVLLYLMFG
jgi:hypothetical protein